MIDKSRKILFLDRDGTLIYDENYLREPLKIDLIPGVVSFLRLMNEMNIELHVVSNQSGVGRGKISLEEFENVDLEFRRIFASHDIEFNSISYCTHIPDDFCKCRKPEVKLFNDVIEKSVFPSKMAFLGNAKVDELASLKLSIEYWNVPETRSITELENFFEKISEEVKEHFHDI